MSKSTLWQCFATFFLCFIGAVVLLSFFWTPYSVSWMDLSKEFESPSMKHPFGLGENGIDVFSHVMLGFRTSIIISVSVSLLCAMLGVFIGLSSALKGGRCDSVLVRVMDFFNSFPSLILFMAVLTFFGQGFFELVFALTLSGWASYSRVVRAQSLNVLNEPYIEAAKSQGASFFRILSLYIFPQLIPYISAQLLFGIQRVVLVEASLSFLGLGLSAEFASLGRLLAQGREAMLIAPHLILFPGIALFLLLLSVISFGDKVQRLWIKAQKV